MRSSTSALLLTSAAAVVVGGFLLFPAVGDTQERLRAAQNTLHGAQRGQAFACGYLYGQRGIIAAARLPIALPEPLTSCPREMDNAATHGFTQAQVTERKIQQ